jgi:hypothetical protein
MSDWELVLDVPAKKQPKRPQSDWEVVPQAAPSERKPNESFGKALLRAPYRVGEDLYKGAAGAIQSIPGYIDQAKTEVPGAFKSILQHPGRSAAQLGAGITEMGHNVLNAPRGLADYASNRLNLLPEEYAKKVPYQDDISEDINNVFGKPQYAGEKLIRGAGRNLLNAVGGYGTAKALNPLNLTAKSIAKDVIKEEGKQVKEHSKRYNKIWDEAEKSGFNQVPVNQQLLSDNLSVIEKYKTPKEYQSMENFILDPTLQNAQKAQSDMGIMHRKLEEKSRSGSLNSEEQALYKAALESEKHIEQNMFKDASGNAHDALQDKYQKLSKSYRQNVVPYKYNRDIQNYKAKEMLPNELVNKLSRGEFAAKKGSKHRAIGIRNNLGPLSIGGTAGVALPWLLKQMFGDNKPEQ